MPRYDYECEACQHRFELKQGFDSDPVTTCPKCEARARRMFHSVPIMFKGSGWYVNDYGKRGGTESTSESKTSTESASKVKGETSSDTQSNDSSSGDKSKSNDSSARSDKKTGSSANSEKRSSSSASTDSKAESSVKVRGD